MGYKISIIIPTYNRANYLKQTIESALAQDYENYEVIVLDNASTDSTAEVIEKYLDNDKFRYYRNETNIGMVKNWHKAIYEYSTGDWFLILSDDDYFIDSKYLTQAVLLMHRDEKICIVYANGYIKHEDTGKMVPLKLPFNEINDGKKIFSSRGTVKPQDFTLCNILFKKNDTLRFKSFENKFNVACDSELFLNMCVYGKVAIVNDYVSVYRVHSNNLIKEVEKSWEMLINNYDALFKPYIEAKKSGKFSLNEISLFEKQSILPSLRTTLIGVKLHFPNRYKDYLHYLNTKDEQIFNKLLLYTKYDLRVIMANFPILYKFIRKIKNGI